MKLYTIYLNNALQFPSICQGVSDAFYRFNVTHNLLHRWMKVYQTIPKIPPSLQYKNRSSAKASQKDIHSQSHMLQLQQYFRSVQQGTHLGGILQRCCITVEQEELPSMRNRDGRVSLLAAACHLIPAIHKANYGVRHGMV